MENSTELVSLRGMVYNLPEFLQLLRNKRSQKRQEAIRSYVNWMLNCIDSIQSEFEDKLAKTSDERDEQEIVIVADEAFGPQIPDDENISWEALAAALSSTAASPHSTPGAVFGASRAVHQSEDWSRFYTPDGMPRGMF